MSARLPERTVAALFIPLRATTRRGVDGAAIGATDATSAAGATDATGATSAAGATDAVDALGVVRRVFAVVALRAPVLRRGTTRRSVVFGKGAVLTTVLMGLKDWDVVTPGFRSVRI